MAAEARRLLAENPQARAIMLHTWAYGPDTPAIMAKRLMGRNSGGTGAEFRQAYPKLLSSG